jgi:hypothetical protein
MTRLTRLFAPLFLAITLMIAVAPGQVLAQANSEGFDNSAQEAPSEGRVWDGYFLTGIFVFGVLFLIGKSARR